MGTEFQYNGLHFNIRRGYESYEDGNYEFNVMVKNSPSGEWYGEFEAHPEEPRHTIFKKAIEAYQLVFPKEETVSQNTECRQCNSMETVRVAFDVRTSASAMSDGKTTNAKEMVCVDCGYHQVLTMIETKRY